MCKHVFRINRFSQKISLAWNQDFKNEKANSYELQNIYMRHDGKSTHSQNVKVANSCKILYQDAFEWLATAC